MHLLMISEDPVTIMGARMSGFEVREVQDPADLRFCWREAVEEKDIAIIYLSRFAGSHLQEEIEAFRQNHRLPLVVVLPEGEEAVHDRAGK